MASQSKVALSYFRLYACQAQQSQHPNTDDAAQNQVLWTEDEWSPQDVEAAEKYLLENADRCKVNATTRVPRDTVAWDHFYTSHQENFFKDRHYLEEVFSHELKAEQGCWVEAGCGVGNAMLPFVEKNPGWKVVGFDISSVAVDLLQKNERFLAATGRVEAHCLDLSKPDAIIPSCRGKATVASLLFCLSAMSKDAQVHCVQNVAATLAPGGALILRDYGYLDEAHLKLAGQRNKRLDDNFYTKLDGTKCYYFTLDELSHLMEQQAGLQVEELHYIRRVYHNRGDKTKRRRVWVHGRFRKPSE